MKLEEVKVSELKKLEMNVRSHGQIQINELKRSLQQFGQTRAVVIDEENNILIGNGLYMAMKELGMETCQCYRKTGLSENEKKKLILTDNRVYALGSDNYDAVDIFLNEITSSGDFDIAGFDEDVLKEMCVIEDNDLELAVSGAGGFSMDDEPMAPIEPEFADEEKPAEKEEVRTYAEEPESRREETPEEEPEGPVSHAIEHRTRKIICPNCGEVIFIDN